MSKIIIPIPQQSFELIRERIGEIVADEISTQVLLTYDTSIDAEVLIESTSPIDKTGLPTINVSLASGFYDNKDYSGYKRGNPYVYNIDVYTSGERTEDKSGDYNSNVLLQRLIAICGYVLDHPVYKTLGFKAPLIERVYVSNIDIANKNTQDALNSCFGRITFNVVVAETTTLIVPQLLAGFDTQVKLGTTEKGFVYTDNTNQS